MKSVLRVGVDFHAFDGKFQGSRSHLIGLYRAMIELSPDIQFVFFLHDIDGLRQTSGFDRPNVSFGHMGHANPLLRLGWQLPKLSKQHRIDILHTQYITPLWGACGSAVTIHDILFEDYPQFFTPFFAWRSKLLFRRSARTADIVMTVSEYSRGEIMLKYGVPAERIGLLLNAVDLQVFHPDEGRDAEILARRGLASGRYFLTVGRIEPRKDHATLLQAYAQLGESALPLVIVGQRDFGYGAFDAALAALPSREKVHVLSDVGDKELPALLRHAHTFIYPSLAEGFGMPPLEAMASGVPVIVANSTALPEVVGDAGVLFSPGNSMELATCMHRLLQDAELRVRLVDKGLARARTFSWHGSAHVLRSALLRWHAALQ